MALTNKQQAFIEYYLQCWNASEAARLAGYSEQTAYSTGSRLLKNVEVQEAVRVRLVELKASADEVLTRFTSHARGTMESFMLIRDDGSAALDLVKASEAKQLHLIKKLKTTRRTFKEGESEVTNEVELYDAQAALSQLGRHHKLFTDRVEDDRIKVLTDEYNAIQAERAELERARASNTD